jgi:hypothetical protein
VQPDIRIAPTRITTIRFVIASSPRMVWDSTGTKPAIVLGQ